MRYRIRHEAENILYVAQNVWCCIRCATYNIECTAYDIVRYILYRLSDVQHRTLRYRTSQEYNVVRRHCTSERTISYVYDIVRQNVRCRASTSVLYDLVRPTYNIVDDDRRDPSNDLESPSWWNWFPWYIPGIRWYWSSNTNLEYTWIVPAIWNIKVYTLLGASWILNSDTWCVDLCTGMYWYVRSYASIVRTSTYFR